MIVLDCSAAINVIEDTPEGTALRMLMEKGERAIAPAVFRAEVTHAYEKRVRGGLATIDEAMGKAESAIALVDEFVGDGELWREALSESLRLGHSSYDMLYFVLARRRGATLLTLDCKLQQLCADNGVNCLWLDNEFDEEFTARA